MTTVTDDQLQSLQGFSGELVRVLPQWSGTDGILHLVFASRRGMLPSVRAMIDFAAAALKSSAI